MTALARSSAAAASIGDTSGGGGGGGDAAAAAVAPASGSASLLSTRRMCSYEEIGDGALRPRNTDASSPLAAAADAVAATLRRPDGK